MAEQSTAFKKEVLITTKTGWFDIDWQELWRARGLVYRLFHRDFICSYKQTIFGYAWFVIPPVINTLVFTFMFSAVAKISTDGAPPFLFQFLGVLTWAFFAACVNKTASTFVGNSGLFKKVYFPRFAVPVAGLLSNLLTLGIQAVLFAIVFLYFGFHGEVLNPGIHLLWVPVIFFLFAIFGIGAGLFVASLTTTYRDMVMLTGMALQLLMYGSCVVYPLSAAPAKWQSLFALNPVVPLMETLRHALFGSQGVSGGYLAWSVAFIALIFLVGAICFHRAERTFTDTV